MHVADEAKVLLVARRLAYRLPPFLEQLEDPLLHATGSNGRPFGEPPDELVEKVLGADLQLERVAAVFDADVEELRVISSVFSDSLQ